MNGVSRVSGWKSLGVACLLSVGLLAGCASAPADPQARAAAEAINDPLEPFNRAMLEFNKIVDHFVLKPVMLVYQIVPPPVREGVHSALENLRSPVVLANDLLQGETERAGNTVSRFAINSTVGLLGFWDAADKWFGIQGHSEDFGQTLASWGVAEGPYLVLPLVGPSNPRDAFGLAVDSAADPLNWYLRNIDEDEWIYTRLGLTVIDSRTEVGDTLDALERTSLDFYASLRTIYRQRRADEIRNRTPTQKPVAPSISMAAKPDNEIEKKAAQ
ncbi:VacJ family lipoprotein [Ferrovibrio sp.]|uniref:MlaA family lipoprotein n=1 Tax=Ferrovibrio sp. TaxID=1917215 RepID=UPI0035B4571E